MRDGESMISWSEVALQRLVHQRRPASSREFGVGGAKKSGSDPPATTEKARVVRRPWMSSERRHEGLIRASKGVMRHSAPYLIGRALDAHTPDPNRYRSAQLFSIWICAVSLAEASDS